MDDQQHCERPPESWPGRGTQAALLLTCGVTLASASPPQSQAEAAPFRSASAKSGEIEVLTYNVKGLPWPVASGREQAIARIGERLAAMRREGRQPGVVVLQEVFTSQAKAIGNAAGYAWQVQGPYARSEPGNPVRGSWYLGETQPAMLDSGLAVFSDYPVLAVKRSVFPEGDCAGFDCLAAKGVLLVTLDVPGAGPVTVAATHLNSRKASGAPFARANAAYTRQATFLGNVLRARKQASGPLILVGDFNRGDRPTRMAALDAALDRNAHALGRLADAGRLDGARRRDFSTIRRRGRDMQFASNGPSLRVKPIAAHVPFGTERDGTMLSDHLGYTVCYRLTTVSSGPVRLATSTR